MASIKCGVDRVVQYEPMRQRIIIGEVNGRQSGNGVIQDVEIIPRCRRCGIPGRRCDLDKTVEDDLSPQLGGYFS